MDIMKKLFMVGAVALLAMFGVTAAASAHITNRSADDPVTANGILAFQGSIITATCDDVVLNGTVTDPSAATGSVTGGRVAGCDNASVSVGGFPWEKVQNLDGTWSVGTVTAQVTGAFGAVNCHYSGSLSGTWLSDGVNTYLTVTGNTLRLVRNAGILPCTTAPTVTGELTLLGVASS